MGNGIVCIASFTTISLRLSNDGIYYFLKNGNAFSFSV
jgi:hypothetical protein